MAKIRQEKISNLIKRELALIFQQKSHDLFGGRFITVTLVRVTSDLGLARVYLSFLAVNDEKEELEAVKRVTGQIRGLLGNKTGKQLRRIPELEFYVDDSMDYSEEIDRLLKD